MENNLVQLIKEFKDGDDTKFLIILEKMKPLINKYVRHLYNDEKEDMREEFILALLMSVRKMNYCNNEGQAICYLRNSIKNKFLELYRKSQKRNEYEMINCEEFWTQIPDNKERYDEINMREDFRSLLSGLNEQTYNILYEVLLEGFSDAEVALKYNISRQYVHRIKKKYYHILKEKYFT